ncbi:hypothetical protein CANINC_000718 [Pichia inconspicua]|uniref:Uncharacterized protein n=1 Tax=Pichia inconspicua TaxID=52247 RepID=A0A4T0X730_9ASCO|nr:hypothetical protein CANINC_000718 [[Candida] inconspicua]
MEVNQSVGELVDKFRRAQMNNIDNIDVEVDDVESEEEEGNGSGSGSGNGNIDNSSNNDNSYDSYDYVSDVSDVKDFQSEEWDSIVTQVQLLVLIVAIPLTGKFLGRRFAHKIWSLIGNYYYK